MREDDIGLAVTTPDRLRNRDSQDGDTTNAIRRYVNGYINDDGPLMDLEAPDVSAFTFSEDDLLPSVPSGNQWTAAGFNPPSIAKPKKKEKRRVYSDAERNHSGTKITVERTFVVSEPTPSQAPRAPSPEARPKSRGLSRTLSGLRRKGERSQTQAPQSRQTLSRAAELENARLIEAQSRSKSQTRRTYSFRSKRPTESAPQTEPTTLSWFSARRSFSKTRDTNAKAQPTSQARIPPPDEPKRRPSTPISDATRRLRRQWSEQWSKTAASHVDITSNQAAQESSRHDSLTSANGQRPTPAARAETWSPSSKTMAATAPRVSEHHAKEQEQERPVSRSRLSSYREKARTWSMSSRSQKPVHQPVHRPAPVAEADEQPSEHRSDRPVSRSRLSSYRDKVRTLSLRSNVQRPAEGVEDEIRAAEPSERPASRSRVSSYRDKARTWSLKSNSQRPATRDDADAAANGGTERKRTDTLTYSEKDNSFEAAQRPSDELWQRFSAIEHDCEEFSRKPIGSRASTMEATLSPFLKSRIQDVTPLSLRADDLKRRCNILDKWWSGLMDSVDHWNDEESTLGECALAVDCIVRIIRRSEWRRILLSSDIVLHDPDHERSKVKLIHGELQEIYVRNLRRLVSLVVERLASSEGSAFPTQASGMSLVYAFFFCPGVASKLIRLWRVPSNIANMMNDQGPASFSTELSTEVIACFPKHLKSLTDGVAARSTIQLLKRQLDYSPSASTTWQDANWLARWRGEKSELFFIFIKQFHRLLADFVPEDATRSALQYAPGVAAIQAQMTVVLRSALVKRQSASQGTDIAELVSPSFESLVNADGTIVQHPASAQDTARVKLGRRFVKCVSEVLGDVSSYGPQAKRLFAHSTFVVLKATAKQISLYDHDACLSLCDFLEQVLPILKQYESRNQSTILVGDSAFWVDVWKHMLTSDNTFTAMRVFTLIYTLWPDLTIEPQWKHNLCYKLLLDEKLFNTHFSHWCPLVRVYYMRVLAWRVARYDGDDHGGELMIMKTLFFRVQQTWAYFKYQHAQATKGNCLPLSTGPVNPIPGRRLLIMRLDSPPPTAESMTDAAKFSEAPGRMSQLMSKLSSIGDGAEQGKRRSGLFRSRSRSTAPRRSEKTVTESNEANSMGSNDQQSALSQTTEEDHRKSVYESRLSAPVSIDASISQDGQSNGSPQVFKFSMEFVDPQPLPEMDLKPPRLPRAAQKLLESHKNFLSGAPASKPTGPAAAVAVYMGRALAEWSLVVNECQNFFDRRMKEGVQSSELVEAPSLGVEYLRKPV